MGNSKKGRRRITRRPSTARSNTTLDLSRNPFTLAGDVGRVAPEPRTDREGLSNFTTSFESFPSITNSVAYRQSPTTSIRSGSSTPTDSRKKHLFGFKFKDNDRPQSSPASPHPLSTPPPGTPVKALEMLGFDCEHTRDRSRSLGSLDWSDDEPDDLLGRSVVEQQASTTSLVTPKDLKETDTKPEEQNIGTDTHNAKGFWDTSTKKMQRMLGLRSTKASSIRHEADLKRSRVEISTLNLREESKVYQSSASNLQSSLPLRPSAPRPIAETPRRRKRKKTPKSLDRMPPITEASHDELRNSYNDYEHNTELELISEYEYDASYFRGSMPSSRAQSLHIPSARYELSKEDLSPSDLDSEERNDIRGKDPIEKYADKVDFKRLDHQPPTALYLRSPLQAMEYHLLDATEANLVASRTKQNFNDASIAQIDAEVSSLRESNRVMKEKFEAIRSNIRPLEKSNSIDSENENEEDTVSICSSIDLEEEPIICEAKAMTFTRVTPGMIKLVDIPPKRRTNAMPSGHKANPVPPTGVKPLLNPIYCFKNGTNPSPSNGRTRNGEPATMPSHLTIQDLICSHKARKANIPREESRILARDCVPTHDSTKQRPDIVVLTNPPPPPPSRPPRTSSKEHYCIKNGHILHPVNLKTVPDESAINSLQVNPYLRTPGGRKEHVHIPVFCNRCGEDVKEEMWECDVAVCHMVCCKKCALDMEREWKERVTAAWKY